MRAKFVKEDAMGGVSAPGATLNNVPGTGNATPPATTDMTTMGSGDRWDNDTADKKKKKKKKKATGPFEKPATQAVAESNMNPYDKIAAMMGKKMGVKSPFKKKDSRTNTVEQEFFEEADEPVFKLPTLDQYAKAAEHVPVHPLENRKDTRKNKTVNEAGEAREEESLKDVKAKQELEKLAIPYIYKQGPSGRHRVYIKGININDVVKKLIELDWTVAGKNPENTIKKFHKDGIELAIFADGKDLPRVTVKTVEETGNDMIESVLAKKVVSNSLEPYI
jgi:uncharacterized protein (UPF0216 family)